MPNVSPRTPKSVTSCSCDQALVTKDCPELSRFFGSDVVAKENRQAAARADVYESEWKLVAAAGKRRQADFLNGRACAHACITALGAQDAPLPVGPKGAPIWPPGIVGSITHCEGFCAAAATWDERCNGIGIDAERRARVERDLEHLVLTVQERTALRDLPEDVRRERATLIFSAKESFYKAQFGLTDRFLDFHDVSVVTSDQHFVVVLKRPVAGLGITGDWFEGSYTFTACHVLTGITL